MSFLDLLQKRRTIYALGKNLTQEPEHIVQLITNVVKNTPSSFNSQSSRAVILLNQHHEEFWEIVKRTLAKIVPAENFAPTEERINMFQGAYGTVLFFEDKQTVQKLKEDFAAYADNFELWSEQASGITQFAVWLALAEQNIGASLQHYNPLIDDEVKQRWQIPAGWRLRSQMPFGSIEAAPKDKAFLPSEQRVKVFD